MGNTTGGLPWPESSLPVRDGALAIRSLAEAVEGKYGPRNKIYLDVATPTDVNGLFGIPVPTTAIIMGCLVQERFTADDANQNPIYVRAWQVDQTNHRINCRAWFMSPWQIISNGSIAVSALVWTA